LIYTIVTGKVENNIEKTWTLSKNYKPFFKRKVRTAEAIRTFYEDNVTRMSKLN